MKDAKFEISPGAVLLFALVYFFDGSGIFALLLPAVLVHEAGHLMFLRLGGARLHRLSFGLFGLEMDYIGCLDGLYSAVAIAAGPFLGLVYGTICLLSKSEFWRLSGGLSVMLSAFNLLPVLPLDGGRLLMIAARERGESISRGISVCLSAAGFSLWLSRGWFSLFAMGLWLAWCNFKIAFPLRGRWHGVSRDG